MAIGAACFPFLCQMLAAPIRNRPAFGGEILMTRGI
jgi:hypothetical protein